MMGLTTDRHSNAVKRIKYICNVSTIIYNCSEVMVHKKYFIDQPADWTRVHQTVIGFAIYMCLIHHQPLNS